MPRWAHKNVPGALQAGKNCLIAAITGRFFVVRKSCTHYSNETAPALSSFYLRSQPPSQRKRCPRKSAAPSAKWRAAACRRFRPHRAHSRNLHTTVPKCHIQRARKQPLFLCNRISESRKHRNKETRPRRVWNTFRRSGKRD
jgi:hypothetical protein